MKFALLGLRPVLTFVTAAGLALTTFAAPSTPSPKGHWEGEITMMAGPLAIKADFSAAPDKSWQGTIDMPGGIRAFKLGGIKVDGSAIEFALPGIPGDPTYTGKFSDDAKSIAGEFKQGNRSLPFKLERKSDEPAPPPAPPAPGVAGKGLVGHWLGGIKPIPGVELHLGLEVTSSAPTKYEGVLVSIDQNNGRIPLEEIVEKDGAVSFAAAGVKGTFEGKFNADGSELVGVWTQVGHPIDLVLRRQAKP